MKKISLVMIPVFIIILALVGCNAAESASLDFTATVIPPVGGSVYLPGNSVKSVFRSGQAIALDIYPEAGMVLEDLTYTLGAKSIVIRQNQFFMPAGEVTIQAKFASKYSVSVVLDRSAVSLIGQLQLHATITGADAHDPSLKLVWMSMNESIVRVDQTGKLTALSVGQTRVQVREEFTQRYAECTVTVPENIFTVSGQTITGIKTDARVPQDLFIPEVIFGVTMRSIGADAFNGKNAIATVVLPDSIESIGARAFANTSIKEVTIPKNVHTIERESFAGTQLEKVHVQASNVPSFGANALPVRKEEGANGSFRMLPELIVPVGQADAYRTALSDYTYHIRAENEYFVRSISTAHIAVNPLSASAGSRVAVNISPPVGKTFTPNGVVAALDDGTRFLIGQVDGAFNFAMPENSVTVIVTFSDEILGLKFTPRSKLRGNVFVELNTATDQYVVNLVPHNGYVVKTISARSLDGKNTPLAFETVTVNNTYVADRNRMNDVEFDIEWMAQEYTVLLHNTGGSSEGSTSGGSIKATYGEYLPKRDSGGPSIIPTKNGYTFDGYSVETFGSSAEQYYTKDLVPAKVWLLTQNNLELKAYWQAKMYTVTLEGNGGTPTTRTVSATFNQPLPVATVPTKEFYDFAGYADITTGTKYYDENMRALGVWDKAYDGTIQAIWKPRLTEIILDADLPPEVKEISGVDWTRYLDPKNVTTKIVATKGSVLPTLDAAKLKPSLKSFEFQGFYSEPNGKGKKYYDGNLNPHPTLSEDDIAANVSRTSNWDILDKKVTVYGHWKFGGNTAVFLTAENLQERNYTLTTGFYGITRDITINRQQQTVQEGKSGIQIAGTVIVYFQRNVGTGEPPVLMVYGENAMADDTDYGSLHSMPAYKEDPNDPRSKTIPAYEKRFYKQGEPMAVRFKSYIRDDYWTYSVTERDGYMVGGNGGGAGIEINVGNALYLRGDGIIKAYGGGGRSAFNGQPGQVVPKKDGHKNPAVGGVGGGGGGGGGAGIGTNGGSGGAGAPAAGEDWPGNPGSAGLPAVSGGGILHVAGTLQITAIGGIGGVHGVGGVGGETPTLKSRENEGGGGGGGGGGAGGRGAGIGSGGSGGSGGGSGGSGIEAKSMIGKHDIPGAVGYAGNMDGSSGKGGEGANPTAGKVSSGGGPTGGTGVATAQGQANTVILTWKSSAKLPDLGTRNYTHEGKPATIK